MVVLLQKSTTKRCGGLRMNLCSGRLPLWQLRWAGPSVARLGRDVHESCVGVPQHLCDLKAGALRGKRQHHFQASVRHRKNRSVNGRVQRDRLGGREPGLVATEHICDLDGGVRAGIMSVI